MSEPLKRKHSDGLEKIPDDAARIAKKFLGQGAEKKEEEPATANPKADGDEEEYAFSSSYAKEVKGHKDASNELLETTHVAGLGLCFSQYQLEGKRWKHREGKGTEDTLASGSVRYKLWPSNAAEQVHYFAVFDGHGGRHVARVLAAHVGEVLQRTFNEDCIYEGSDNVVAGRLKTVLTNTVLALDEKLRSDPKWHQEMREARHPADAEKGEDDDEDDDEVGEPVEVHVERYGSSFFARECGAVGAIVLVTRQHVLVACLGDPVVLVARGEATPVVCDPRHLAYEADEHERVMRNGGLRDGRVGGSLIVTRAFGDFLHKTEVVYNPADNFKGDMTEWSALRKKMRSRVAAEPLISNLPAVWAFNRSEGVAGVVIGSDGLVYRRQPLELFSSFVRACGHWSRCLVAHQRQGYAATKRGGTAKALAHRSMLGSGDHLCGNEDDISVFTVGLD